MTQHTIAAIDALNAKNDRFQELVASYFSRPPFEGWTQHRGICMREADLSCSLPTPVRIAVYSDGSAHIILRDPAVMPLSQEHLTILSACCKAIKDHNF